MANRPIVRDRACSQCNKRPIAGYKFCSNACREKAKYARQAGQPGFAEYNRQKNKDFLERRFGPASPGRKRIAPHPCEVCGTLTQRPRCCSYKCSTKTEASLACARRQNSVRRARLRGAMVEVFDPIEVLIRDGWKCHICGRSTPKSLRGTYDPRAPELDHIVPLAAGGEHSRKNTACACRECNLKKSNRPFGQIRLFA